MPHEVVGEYFVVFCNVPGGKFELVVVVYYQNSEELAIELRVGIERMAEVKCGKCGKGGDDVVMALLNNGGVWE